MNPNPANPETRDKVNADLGSKSPAQPTLRRDSLPHLAYGSEVNEPKRKAAKNHSAPLPAVPPSAIRMAKIGGTVALIAAAAISAQTLVSLGHLLGLHDKIAWLLPVSLDVYAATSIWVGYRIPAIHPAAGIARRDARLALALTVCCNALYHLLLLAGSQLPQWLTDTLLILVGALPPLVVERIFHLQMAVRDGDGTEHPAAASGSEAPKKPGSERPAAAAPPAAAETAAATNGAGNGSRIAASGNRPATAPAASAAPTGSQGATVLPLTGNRRSPEDWAQLALPLWRQYLAKHGETPTAPVLANLLRNAHPNLPVPGSERSERNIRAAVEKLLEPDADDERADERAQAVNL